MKTLKVWLTLLAGALFAPGALAQGIPVIDAAAIVQWTLQIKAMTDQLSAMQQNLQSQTQQLTTNPVAALNNISSSITQAEAMAGSAQKIADAMQKNFGSDVGTQAVANYQQWMKATKDTIRATLAQSGVHLDGLANEAQALQALAAMSQSSAGNLQVQQAGNQIAVEMVSQLQKLRSMQIAQSQAINAVALAQQQKEESNNEVSRRMVGGAQLKLDAATIQKLKDM